MLIIPDIRKQIITRIFFSKTKKNCLHLEKKRKNRSNFPKSFYLFPLDSKKHVLSPFINITSVYMRQHVPLFNIKRNKISSRKTSSISDNNTFSFFIYKLQFISASRWKKGKNEGRKNFLAFPWNIFHLKLFEGRKLCWKFFWLFILLKWVYIIQCSINFGRFVENVDWNFDI